MILAAGLLVLLGLGLFVGGVLTGATWLYWACVAACVAAAVLIGLVRRSMPSPTTGETARADAATGNPAAERPAEPTVEAPQDLPDPGVEEAEVTDLLLVVDLEDEVLVVDERPRYHLEGCRYLAGRTTIPLPVDEARGDGFTPCATCEPDRNLAQRARARRKAGRGS